MLCGPHLSFTHLTLCFCHIDLPFGSPSSHRLADHLCTSGTFVGVSVAFSVCDRLDYIHPLVWTWGEKDCLDCQELSGIVKDCHTHVMTVLLRLKGADATDYRWYRTQHSWRYKYMMKIENAFLCWVPLWVEKIPTSSRGPVGVGTPCEWTIILNSSEMSTFSPCVCLFVTKMSFFHFVSVCFFRRTSTFSLWESRK